MAKNLSTPKLTRSMWTRQNDNLAMIEILQKYCNVDDEGALDWLTNPYCNIRFIMNKIFIKQIKEAQHIILPTTNIFSIIHLNNKFNYPATFGTLYVSNAKSQVLELTIKSAAELQGNRIKVYTIINIGQILDYSIVPLLNKFIKHLRDTDSNIRTILRPPPTETGNHPKIYTDFTTTAKDDWYQMGNKSKRNIRIIKSSDHLWLKNTRDAARENNNNETKPTTPIPHHRRLAKTTTKYRPWWGPRHRTRIWNRTRHKTKT